MEETAVETVVETATSLPVNRYHVIGFVAGALTGAGAILLAKKLKARREEKLNENELDKTSAEK